MPKLFQPMKFSREMAACLATHPYKLTGLSHQKPASPLPKTAPLGAMLRDYGSIHVIVEIQVRDMLIIIRKTHSLAGPVSPRNHYLNIDMVDHD